MKDWDISVVDSAGQSRGLLCAWNLKLIKCIPYVSHVGIWMECCLLGWNDTFNIFNVYGPYNYKEVIWKRIVRDSLLRHDNVILAGYLNFTLSSREIWSLSSRLYTLLEFFNNFFIEEGLFDVEPLVLSPAWSNGRMGVEGISKCLDYFLAW